MGGNKLKLSHQKKKPALLLSLHTSLTNDWIWLNLNHGQWMLVKLVVVSQDSHPWIDATITLAVHNHFAWTLSVLHKQLDPSAHPSLSHLPSTLISAQSIRALLQVIDSLALCVGNPDEKFQELWKHRSVTLHGSSGIVMFIIICSKQCINHIYVPCRIGFCILRWTKSSHHYSAQWLSTVGSYWWARSCSLSPLYQASQNTNSARNQDEELNSSSPASHVNLR